MERIKANSSLAISPQLLIGGAGVGGRDKALPLGKFFLIISLGAKTVTKLRKIYKNKQQFKSTEQSLKKTTEKFLKLR